jgi:hypothetical protein
MTYAHFRGRCRCGKTHADSERDNGADRPRGFQIVATYDYRASNGKVLFQTVRLEPKDFRQRRPSGPDWIWNLKGVRLVLYRLPELHAALAAGDTIYVVEGEKDADRIHAVGAVATTSPLGAGKWRPEYAELFRGSASEVRVVADRDATGYQHSIDVAASLRSTGVTVRVVEAAVGKDVSDHLDAGHTLEDLVEITPEGVLRSEDPAISVDSVHAWEDPVEFGTDEFGAPVPLEAFPNSLASYVESLADSYQVAPDLPAGAVLGMAAAAAAGRAEVAIGDTHVEPLNLYVAPVLPPGERKKVIRETSFPLEDEERRLCEAAAPVIAEARVKRAFADRRMKRLEDRAAKSKDALEVAEAHREALELAKSLPVVPSDPRLLLDDATPESLAKALAEQQGCIAIVSEEAGNLFEVMCGKYRDGVADLDVYLKAYDGGPIRVVRISREPLTVENPALSILVTPQPAVLDRLAERSELRGRGLLGRIAFILPPSRVGTRMYQNVAIDPAAKAAYGEALGRILRLPRCSRDDPNRGLVIRGKPLDIWAGYANQIEREQAEGGRLYGVRDWASKHAGRVARIAGIFHLVEPENWPAPFAVPITPETVAAAWAVGQWLCHHALAAFSRMGTDPKVAMARRILGWIHRDRPEHFTLRDLQQHFRAQVELPADLLPGLEVLEGRGFVRRRPEEPDRRPGRKRSPTFDVNPRTYTHNTQNTAQLRPRADSVYCESSALDPA